MQIIWQFCFTCFYVTFDNGQVRWVCVSEHKHASIIVYTRLINNVLVCAVHLFGNT